MKPISSLRATREVLKHLTGPPHHRRPDDHPVRLFSGYTMRVFQQA
jgi:hypothetical protein